VPCLPYQPMAEALISTLGGVVESLMRSTSCSVSSQRLSQSSCLRDSLQRPAAMGSPARAPLPAQYHDLVIDLEMGNQLAADKAGSSGNQNLHRCTLLLPFALL